MNHPIQAAELCDGYVQTVDKARIVAAARESEQVERLDINVGDYVLSGQKIGALLKTDENLARTVSSSIRLGIERTLAEDPTFAIERITEVAVRCLSPGINDPYTALACIDQLGRIFNELAAYYEPATCFRDEVDDLRLVMLPVRFDEMLESAFGPILANVGEQYQVSTRMAQLLDELCKKPGSPDLTTGLEHQLAAVHHKQALGR